MFAGTAGITIRSQESARLNGADARGDAMRRRAIICSIASLALAYPWTIFPASSATSHKPAAHVGMHFSTISSTTSLPTKRTRSDVLIPLAVLGSAGVSTSSPSPPVPVAPAAPPTPPWQAGLPAILVQIAWCESRDEPTAVNPQSGDGGLFQIDPRTWLEYGGVGLPQDATPDTQAHVALAIYQADGSSPWTASESCWA